MSTGFEGKVAIVTGAASGIGYEVALQLASRVRKWWWQTSAQRRASRRSRRSVWLLGPEAGYVTGHALVMDGGRLAK
jgi:NAD(P)-dependent dehydrogenase (short-subunit alcohol dehydrogenase family)